MIELTSLSGLPTAIIRDAINSSEIEQIRHVQALWITPADRSFRLTAPLRLPLLKRLYINGCRQRLLDMVCRSSIEGIRNLIVADSEGALAGALELGGLNQLKGMAIRQQRIAEDAADWITQQAAVTLLSLTDTNVTDDTIGRLASRRVLKRLDLFRTNVTLLQSDSLDRPFPLVRSLDVSETRVSSDSVPAIRFLFPSLEQFIAHRTQLTMDDLRKIASWEGMKVLQSNTPGVDFDFHQRTFWDL